MIDAQSTSALRIGATRALVVLLLASLAACISSAPQQATRPASASQIQSLEARARAAAKIGDPTAAELYAQLAASTTGTQRIDYLIESARASIARGDTQLARRRLNDAKTGASRDQQQAITVQSARLELGDRKPQAALDMLATLQQPMTVPVQSDAAAVRGQALFELGRPADAVRALVEREVWLDDSASILANQRLIWDGLRKHPPAAPVAPTGDRIVDGWLALAPIATSNPADLRRSLLRWRETYTDHPAAGVLLADLLAAQRATGFPTQIALLLPLTSPQRAQALAIRDGFVAAHLRNAGSDATLDTRLRHVTGRQPSRVLARAARRRRLHRRPAARGGRRASDHASRLRADARAELRANHDAVVAQLLSILAVAGRRGARHRRRDGARAARRPRSRSSRTATAAGARSRRSVRNSSRAAGGCSTSPATTAARKSSRSRSRVS